MLASGAAKGNREIAFSFLDVMRNQIYKEPFDALQKFAGLREGADVAADLGIFSGEAAQAGHKVRIGKEAHIEDEIGIGGHAETIAEAHHGYQHGTLVGILEALGDKVP